jgi:ABC-type dipeptide/oligopeptide/nickel transport system permease component
VLPYVLRRLALLVPTLLGMSILTFSLIHLVPGDPAQVMLGERATPEAITALRSELGLDRPLYVQYGKFLAGLATGDLGRSLKTREKIVIEMAERFPATFELALAAILFASVLGVFAGIVAARWRRSFFDVFVMAGSLAGVSMPIFWLGLLVILLFSVQLGWLPLSGRIDPMFNVPRLTGFLLIDTLAAGKIAAFFDALRHLVLPAFVLGTIPLAVIARMTRAAVLDVLTQDYVRTAWAKGLSEKRVLLVHVLKNALIPTITVIGLQFGYLLGGAIITETIFAWPGVGRWLVLAVAARDFRAVQGGVLLLATVFVLVNLLVDLLYAVADPRIRLEEGGES